MKSNAMDCTREEWAELWDESEARIAELDRKWRRAESVADVLFLIAIVEFVAVCVAVVAWRVCI